MACLVRTHEGRFPSHGSLDITSRMRHLGSLCTPRAGPVGLQTRQQTITIVIRAYAERIKEPVIKGNGNSPPRNQNWAASVENIYSYHKNCQMLTDHYSYTNGNGLKPVLILRSAKTSSNLKISSKQAIYNCIIWLHYLSKGTIEYCRP